LYTMQCAVYFSKIAKHFTNLLHVAKSEIELKSTGIKIDLHIAYS